MIEKYKNAEKLFFFSISLTVALMDLLSVMHIVGRWQKRPLQRKNIRHRSMVGPF